MKHSEHQTPQTPQSTPMIQALDTGLRFLRWIVLGLLVLAIMRTCLLSVAQHEMAFVLRWGRLTGHGAARARAPGLHFVYPYPLEQVVRVPAQRVHTLDSYVFWHTLPKNITSHDNAGGYTITADANLLHSAWAVRYTLKDPERFVFAFDDAAAILRSELNRAVLYASTMFQIDELVRGAREFTAVVERALHQRCLKLQLGVNIEQVELLMLSPPLPTRTAFEDALRAEQDRSAMINTAYLEANRGTQEARATAARTTAQAVATRARIVGEVRAEAEYFTRILPGYLRQPGMIRRILLQETLSNALAQTQTIYLIGDAPNRELRLHITPEPAFGPRIPIK